MRFRPAPPPQQNLDKLRSTARLQKVFCTLSAVLPVAVGIAGLALAPCLAHAAPATSPYELSITTAPYVTSKGCVAIEAQPVIVLPEEATAAVLDIVVLTRGVLPPITDLVVEPETTIGSWKLTDLVVAGHAPAVWETCGLGFEPLRVEFNLVITDDLSGKRVTVDSGSLVLDVRKGETVQLSPAEVDGMTSDMLGLEKGEQQTFPVSPAADEKAGSEQFWEPQASMEERAVGLVGSSGAPAAMTSGSLIFFYGYWKYLESRTNCEPDVAAGGSTDAFFRCSTQGTYKGLRGMRVELWRLRGGSWSKLTTAHTYESASTGYYGFNREISWLDSDQFKIKVFLERRVEFAYDGSWRWRCLDDGGLTWGQTSTISGTQNGSQLYLDFGSWVISGEESRICASLQDAWMVFGGNPDIQDDLLNLEVNFRTEADPGEPCGQSASRYNIGICQRTTPGQPNYDWVWKDGHNLAHEFGHVLHFHAFDNHIQSDYGYGTGEEGKHSWTSAEWQESQFNEGFANFVSAASFYGPSASDPMFFAHHMSIPPNGQYNPACIASNFPATAGPERNEGNFSRFLWDLFDSVNDDAYSDTMNLSADEILSNLYVFPAGTANRYRDEEGPGGEEIDDGPNAWDYYYRLRYTSSPAYNCTNQVYSNCLEDSAWD